MRDFLGKEASLSSNLFGDVLSSYRHRVATNICSLQTHKFVSPDKLSSKFFHEVILFLYI